MTYRYVLAGLAGILASSPALAQDTEEHFEGPRAEALFGYDRVELDVEDEDGFAGNAEDIFYGGAIGYDFQSGMLMFGAEAEIAGSGLSYRETVSDLDVDGTVLDGTARVSSATEYYVGGRVGLVGGRHAVYLKAGYAMSGIDIDLDGTVDGEPAEFGAEVDLDGLRLGVGYEYKVTDRAYLKLEYRYTDFSGAELEALGERIDLGDVFDEVDLERHQAVVGVGFRF